MLPTAKGGDAEDGGGSGPTSTVLPTVTPAPTLSAVPPDETSVAPRVVKNKNDGHLLAVTATTSGKDDVVTFRFSKGAIPGHTVRYVDALRRDDDDVIMLDGSAALTVTFTNSIPGKTGVIPRKVATNDSFDLPMIRQILLAKNLGGTLVFGIGVSTQAPFTVTTQGDSLMVTIPHTS